MNNDISYLQAIKSVEAQLLSLAGPAPNAGLARARATGFPALGIPSIPDPSVTRLSEAEQQFASVRDRTSKYYAPIGFDMGASIKFFHQSVLVDNGTNLEVSPGMWQWLRDRGMKNGIDIALPTDTTAPARARHWRELVKLAATAAPLGDALRAWQRVRHLANDESEAAFLELDFHLRRAGHSRSKDRDLILSPFAPWSTDQAERLAWMGLADEVTRNSLYRAAGHARENDHTYARWLAAHIPASATLTEWAQRRLWDEDIARRYGLDRSFDRSPVATFFSRAHGVGRMPGELPGQPAGEETDWLKLEMRAAAPLPNFGEARILQHRLRPSAIDPATSIVAGAPSWTDTNTRDMLRVQGFPEPVIDRMMGLVFEPINIRLINHILGPYATHPEVRQAATAAFGPDVDWVENAMLDHGFTPAYAKVAAVGVHAQAEDHYNAEKTEHEKAYRQARRAMAMKAYRLGILTTEATLDRMTDDWFDRAMATQQLQLIDEEIEVGIKENIVAAVHEAYLSGKIDLGQMGTQLTVAGINPTRQIWYTQEWTWERGDKSRMLSTGEILAALKSGLMTPAIASQRLINLGWTAGDALVEIAQVEHELLQAKAHADAATAAKVLSSAQTAQRKAEAETKRANTERVKLAKERDKVAGRAALVPLEQEVTATHYDASVLMDWIAYNKAAAKNDTVKMDAELNKAKNAFAVALLAQAKLRQANPEVAHEIAGPAEVVNPSAPPSKGAGKATAEPTSQPGPAPDASSGAGPSGNA